MAKRISQQTALLNGGIPTLVNLVQWYQKGFQHGIHSGYCNLHKCLQANPPQIAQKLLISNHQWYLRFHPLYLQTAINNIVAHSPWNQSFSKYTSFEDVYNDIYKWLSAKYVRQLCVYDFSLNLVAALKKWNLMPHKYVYIHALPLHAYQWLYKGGYVANALKVGGTVNVGDFTGCFGNTLDAYDIENLLCMLGKRIRKDFGPSMQKTLKSLSQAGVQQYLTSIK